MPVFDRSGRHLGTPDLLDEAAGVVGEYDGSLHLQGHQRGRDVRREEVFRSVGLEYFPVVAADAQDREAVVRRMRAARARATFAAPSARAWTTVKPAWWVPTETVEQRRALDGGPARRLFRNRAS